MSSDRDWTIRIRHILESIARIESYTDGMALESFSADNKTVDAVVRNLEVIGEAVRHVPTSVREAHPTLPWREMRDMRNFWFTDTKVWTPLPCGPRFKTICRRLYSR